MNLPQAEDDLYLRVMKWGVENVNEDKSATDLYNAIEELGERPDLRPLVLQNFFLTYKVAGHPFQKLKPEWHSIIAITNDNLKFRGTRFEESTCQSFV